MSPEQEARQIRIEEMLRQLLKLSIGPAPTFDPAIKQTPRAWKGTNMDGRKFSECEPALLSVIQEDYEEAAVKNKGKKTSNDKPLDEFFTKLAAAAGKWAKYNSANAPAQTTQAKPPTDGDDSDIPF